jgi:hypothetical protein
MAQPTKEPNPAKQDFIQQKLAAFDRLQPEFEASFKFVQDVHGQMRFSVFPVSHSVRYLYARWICDCKGLLLSVPNTHKGYEGRRCLELLRRWQEGDTASAVAFLHHKLDMLPLADLTRQLQEAQHLQNNNLAHRLAHGRRILLNRGINLMEALDAIFSLSEAELLQEVQVTSAQYALLPSQIEKLLLEMDTALYSYMPHPLLAQRNMLIMNALGVDVTQRPSDHPEHRTWRVVEPTNSLQPYAEHIMFGYQELVAPTHNNKQSVPFADRVERSDSGKM